MQNPNPEEEEDGLDVNVYNLNPRQGTENTNIDSLELLPLGQHLDISSNSLRAGKGLFLRDIRSGRPIQSLQILNSMAGRGKSLVGSSESKKASTSRSSKAGLQFPVGRIARFLKAGKYAQRVGAGAPVYWNWLETRREITRRHELFPGTFNWRKASSAASKGGDDD
ncbi:hypothetical protein POM88_047715 [Heracleum sosnowskyi]|uniref:Histone H2A n=1 Tax=Heracleum sosnowskyi TaxID=360622 RepID=A0AAD8GU11_9APIA|nr:hypothetical protein POM88_047715 [Heracleum sosnowskyi]